jgi:hypothetical protein
VPNVHEIRDVLAAASDVMFADGVSAAFLDQWAAETAFILDARLQAERRAGDRADSASRRRER